MELDKIIDPIVDLLVIVRAIVANRPGAINELEQFLQKADPSSLVADLAEQISTIVLQKEVREYRLELMIEDLLATQCQLEEARQDPLTGLPNRGVFHEILEKKCAETLDLQANLVLMFVDLDGFKQINDTMGHDVGDEVLIQVTQRLISCCESKGIPARLGGDEFTVIFPDLFSREEINSYASKILDALSTPFTVSAGTASIGASIGISIFPDNAYTPLALLKNADVAMYHAKASGKNTFKYYS